MYRSMTKQLFDDFLKDYLEENEEVLKEYESQKEQLSKELSK